MNYDLDVFSRMRSEAPDGDRRKMDGASEFC